VKYNSGCIVLKIFQTFSKIIRVLLSRNFAEMRRDNSKRKIKE